MSEWGLGAALASYKVLLSSARNKRPWICRKLDGTVPVRRLVPRFNDCKVVILVSDVGITPAHRRWHAVRSFGRLELERLLVIARDISE